MLLNLLAFEQFSLLEGALDGRRETLLENNGALVVQFVAVCNVRLVTAFALGV